jgi:2-oxoisovalerate dehydrogenase E1 component
MWWSECLVAEERKQGLSFPDNEAWFTHRLKVVYPAFPYDAKGLLNASINDPNPVLFFEHKQLYRSVYQDGRLLYLPIGRLL